MKKWLLLYILFVATFSFAQQWWETYSFPGANISKITIAGNKYFALAENGPLLESTYDQNSWVNTNFYFPGLGGDLLADNNTLFIARGEKLYQYDMVSKQLIEIFSVSGDDILCIEKPDMNSLLIGTRRSGVFYSPDNGGSWFQPTSDISAIVFDLYKTRSDTILAATSVGLYFSTDIGENWAPVPGLTAEPVFAVDGNSRGHIVYATPVSVYSFTLNNPGLAVQGFLAQSPNKIDDVIISEDDSIYIAAQFNYPTPLMGGVFGGINFDALNLNAPAYPPITALTYDEVNKTLIFAVEESNIYRRVNGNWQNDLDVFYLDINDTDFGYDQSGNPLLLYVSDYTFGYKNLNDLSGSAGGYHQYRGGFTSLLFVNPDTIFIGVRGEGIFQTDVDRINFSNPVPKVNVTDLLKLPTTGELLISTLDSGIILFNPATGNKRFANGIPLNVPVFSLFYRADGTTGTVYAGAADGTIYFSTDNGNSWSSISVTSSAGIEDDILSVYDDANGNLFAGTRGLGLWLKGINQIWQQIGVSDQYGPVNDIVGSVNGELMVGTEAGLKRFDYKSLALFDEVFNDFAIIKSLRIFPDGTLGVAYHGGGIALKHGFNLPAVFQFRSELWNNFTDGDIVAFDVDQDQDYDILAGGIDSAGNYLINLWEKTAAGYQLYTPFSIPALNGRFDLGDVDNDGDLDILFAGLDSPNSWIVRVNFNDPAGIGPEYVTLATPTAAVAKFGDFNNDGRLDVFVNGDFPGEGIKAKFYYNTGFRSFSLKESFSGLPNASCVVEDFNADGFQDVLCMDIVSGAPESRFYRSDSGRTMVEVIGGSPALDFAKIKAADVNNDGLPDLIMTGLNTNGSPDLIIALNKSNFSFEPMAGTTLPFMAYGILEVADFNGDGLIDILISGLDNTSVPRIELYTYDGTGFSMASGINSPPFVTAGSWLFDEDGDGDLDVAVIGVDDMGQPMGGVLLNLFDNPTNPPLAIKSVNVRDVGKGSVEVNWTMESDDQTPAAGLRYNIKVEKIDATQTILAAHSFMNPVDDTIPLIFGKTNGTFITRHYLRSFPPGDYQVSVQAVDNGWRYSAMSAPVQFTILPWLSPPANPKGIALANQIFYSWNSVHLQDFKYYRIYVKEGNGSYNLVDSTATNEPNDTTFVLKNVLSDMDYYLYVTTVLQTGEESAPSDTVWIHTPAAGIPVPELVHAFPMDGKVQLIWTVSQSSDFKQYNIYAGDSPFTMVRDTVITTRADTMVQIRNLTNKKKYFFTVSVSTTTNGESPKSNIGSAIPGLPEIVALDAFSTAPDSFRIKYIVAPAGNAVNSLAIQMTQSQSFNTFQTFLPPVRQLSGEIPTPFSPKFGNLTSNQQYYVRVVASYDSNGTPVQITSNALSFFTPPQQVILQSPLENQIVQNPVQTFSWTSQDTGVLFELQVKEGNSNLDSGPYLYHLDSLTSENITLYLDFGRTYYWRVRAKNQGAVGPWSEIHEFEVLDAFPQGISVDFTITFPQKSQQDYGPEDYKLFGVPGETGVTLGKYTSGRERIDWRIFRDNGRATNYLEEYDGTGNFSLGNGRGYWIIANSNVRVNDTYNPPVVSRVDSLYYTIIPLQNGWNIITSPYPFAVPWSAIKQLNNLPPGQILYGFENGSYYNSNAFDPYEGYYFENTTGLTELKIPHQISFTKLNKSAFTKSGQTLKTFISISIEGQDKHGIPVILGTAEQASDGKDSYDLRMPVNPFGGTQFYIKTDENDTRDAVYQSWIHSDLNDMDEWILVVTGKKGDKVSLTINDLKIPANKKVYLINLATSDAYDLEQVRKIDVMLYRSEIRLKVLVGGQEDINNQLQKMVPEEFRLSQNFPNPFNPTTTFTMEIPSKTHVTFDIYNILGKKVRSLVNDELDRGIHFVTWDARDDHGQEVPAGIYFYRVVTEEGKAFTGKMIYLK